MTFREAHLLRQGYWQQQKRATVPMAFIAQLLLNIHRDAESKPQPFTLEEVLSWLGYGEDVHQKETERPRRTIEEMDKQITMMHQMYTEINAANHPEG